MQMLHTHAASSAGCLLVATGAQHQGHQQQDYPVFVRQQWQKLVCAHVCHCAGGMTRSQLGFFNIVGSPMFRAMVDLFPDAQPMIDGVNANYAQWQQAAAQAAAKGT